MAKPTQKKGLGRGLDALWSQNTELKQEEASGSVLEALQAGLLAGDDFQNLEALERFTGVLAPAQLRALREKPERFTQVIPREGAAAYVLEALGIPS